MHILLRGFLTEGVNVGRVNVHLVEQVAFEPHKGALFIALDNTEAQFADIESDDIGQTHLVGKVEFDQFVIDLECALACTKADDALPLQLDALVDALRHLECSQCRTVITILDHSGIDLLKASERSHFQFAPGLVIPL